MNALQNNGDFDGKSDLHVRERSRDLAEDKDRKKHPASRRKLRKARSLGQVAFSRQMCSSLSWLAGSVVLMLTLPGIASSLSDLGREYWGHGFKDIGSVRIAMISTVLKAIGPCAAAVAVVCLGAGFMQVRVALKIRMDWSRLNPVKGLKRLASFQRISDVGFVLLRISLVALVGALLFRHNWFSYLFATNLERATSLALHGGLGVIMALGLVGIVGGILDWRVQKRRFLQNQRMTDEEVKRERKDQDGDPAIKAERRRRHRSIMAGTGMASLHSAKVVVINPTHIAVALRYEPSEDDAPMVLATGRDQRAIVIRNKAMSLGIPVVQQVRLARALVSLDEGELVPEEQYEAVAEIIRLVRNMV